MLSEERTIMERTKSKGRLFQGMRSRMTSFDTEVVFPEQSPEEGPIFGSQSLRGQANMAAKAQLSWREAWSRRAHHFLVKKRVSKCFGKCVAGLGVLILLGYFLTTGFLNYVSPGDYNLRDGENPTEPSLEKPSLWDFLLNFFFPTTCTLKGNQEVKVCDKGGDLKASACLEAKCCYSSRISNLSCFAPFNDKYTQKLRLFGFGVISMISTACLLFYCFVAYWKSPWANSLRRIISNGWKWLKRQRNRERSDPEMLVMTMKDLEARAELEEETKALLAE